MLKSNLFSRRSEKYSNHSILLIHSGAIGDLLLTRPAIKAVRRCYPQSIFFACGYRDRLKLLQEDCALHSLLALDDLPISPLFQRDLHPEKPPLPFLAGFHLIISWFGAGNEEFRENLNQLKEKSQIIVASSRPPQDWNRHASEYYLETISPLGINEEVRVFDKLIISPEVGSMLSILAGAVNSRRSFTPSKANRLAGVFAEASGEKKPLVVIHTGSGSPLKNWSARNFAMLVQWLRKELKAVILLISGPADQHSCHDFLQILEGPVPIRIESPSLSDLSAILERCSLYVGNDSGITHLAAAIGIPTVAIFRSSNPIIWKPLGLRVAVIIEEDNLQSSRPLTDTHSRSGNQACLPKRSIDQVVETIKSLL